MKDFTVIAKKLLTLREEKFRIEREIREISQDPQLIAEVATEFPDCITINWHKLAYPRIRR